MSELPQLHAGIHFPWKQLEGIFMRLDRFTPFSPLDGDKVHGKIMNAYGLAIVELPNPDVTPEQRMVVVPIENPSDYKSVHRAHVDRGIKSGENELILLFEDRRGLFGRKPSIHVGAFPKGTWAAFFAAVERYEAQQFPWPDALFRYSPSVLPVFKGPNNIFRA